MGNKSRRDAEREIRLSETQMRQPGMDEMGRAEIIADGRAPQESTLAEEYYYVVDDLRRIALIAAVMLVVLIGLALLLP